jgi:ribonucleoside-triphosphate reductase
MSQRRRPGLKVLKAASSGLRLEVLSLLFERGALSYTEMMKTLRLNPSRDAGRFAYHLKFLLRTDLVEPDVETKKYRLTDLGRTMVSIGESIEQHFFKRRKMMVRTSRFSLEEFDRNKIAESLIKEANVPADSAQKIARETEGRLSEFKAKYLTAPLIREIVNTILIEKGFEEYRHKLTRLGLPVYDVTQLLKSMSAMSLGVEAVHAAAGDRVIEEYTLLNVLPRDIADAHLSGSLHLNNLGCWILKPNELMHDLRFFLKHGLKPAKTTFQMSSSPPPRNFETALLTVSNLLKIAATEVSGEQAIDFFNIFLAPFVKGLSPAEVKEKLRLLFFNLNQSVSREGFPVSASLGIELAVPDFLEKKEATGPEGKTVEHYSDFVEESRLIASTLLELMTDNDKNSPIFNPSLIIKIRPETFKDKECEPLLFQSHRLAAEKGLPYFANLCPKKQKYASYTATGCRFAAEWKEDWELDTLQTGSADSVILNLPRTIYEAEGKMQVLSKFLDDQLEMASRALEIKYRTLRQRLGEGLLPFLTQKANEDRYFRLENATRLISLIGLNEATQAFTGKSMHEDEKTPSFAEQIVKHISQVVQKHARKPEARTVLSMVPNPDAAKRLVELDVEKYGWAKVRAQGTKEQPFYTDMTALPLESTASWQKRLTIEAKFHELCPGSHLAVIQLADSEQDPNRLLSLTKEIAETYSLGLYTFNRNLAYCSSCGKTFYGLPSKCPLCSSVNTMTSFSRESAKYLPTSLWTQSHLSALNKRVGYDFIK